MCILFKTEYIHVYSIQIIYYTLINSTEVFIAFNI